MKLSLWIIILYLCYITASEVCSHSRKDEDHKIYALFKKVYHKKYCGKEDCKRRRIFDKAVARIVQHNLEYDCGLYSYRRGLNEYSDLTHEEFVSRLNGFLGTPQSRRNRPTRWKKLHRLLAAANYPKKLDYRDKHLITPVKDQGQCGSCYAFSSVASLESQVKKVTNRTVVLSEQNIVDCSSHFGNNGCKGGLMTKAFDYIIHNKGIDTERSYPYKAKEGACLFRKSHIGATVSDYDEINNGDESHLLDALVNSGPISVGLDGSHQSFQDYKGGIYDDPHCSNKNLDHAVLLIGYGTENGQDYWLIKNSYGTSWGDNGYGKMVRNKNNQCGLATQACYPIVKN